MFMIVPNYISEAIYAVLDKELEKCPDAKKDREVLYSQILSFYNEHGFVPQDIKLSKPEAEQKGKD